MQKVEVRQNVLIKRDLAGGRSWRESINVSFKPDDVIVRTVAYHNDTGEEGTEAGLAYVATDLLSDNVIGIIKDGAVYCPSQVFTVNKEIRGQYLFEVREVNDSLDVAQGVLMISLEFVKYSK